jgi:protein-tyrosine phosphatase
MDQLARHFNFRDLGGLKSVNGREVRRRTLYRSASLSELAPEHIAAVRKLNIRSVIDLRYNSERETHPTPWQEMGCSAYWCRDYEPAGGRGGLNDLLASESLTNAAARDLMLRVYIEMTYGNVDSLKRLFRTIRTDEGPFLIHCTSGKDRTGIAAALVLSALEVPRDAILADYLATSQFDILASAAFRRDEPFPPERIEIVRPLFSVDSAYLDHMFDGIIARDGSLESFFRKTLDLSGSDLSALRERLLA